MLTYEYDYVAMSEFCKNNDRMSPDVYLTYLIAQSTNKVLLPLICQLNGSK